MQTIVFLLVVGWALSAYGGALLVQLQDAAGLALEGAEIARGVARREWPRVRNTLIALAAITCILFGLALWLVLWGVTIEENRLLAEAGTARDAQERFGLGLIGTLGTNAKIAGWVLFLVFVALQAFRMLHRIAAVGDLRALPREARLRIIMQCLRPILAAAVVLAVIGCAGSFVSFMHAVTREHPSYLLASVAVASGALLFGPWLVFLSRALVVVAWAFGLGYDLVGGVLWKVADVVVDFLATGGLAEKLERRSNARPRFTSWAEAVSWPWVILWFVATAVLMVWPRKVVVLGMFPAAVFGWALYAIMKWRGWDEWFTRIAYAAIIAALIPWWGIKLFMPTVAKVPEAWVAEGEQAAHCLFPGENKQCMTWKMGRAAAELQSGGLLDLPDLPDDLREPALGASAGERDGQAADALPDE